MVHYRYEGPISTLGTEIPNYTTFKRDPWDFFVRSKLTYCSNDFLEFVLPMISVQYKSTNEFVTTVGSNQVILEGLICRKSPRDDMNWTVYKLRLRVCPGDVERYLLLEDGRKSCSYRPDLSKNVIHV